MKINKKINIILCSLAGALFLFSCATNAPIVEYEEGAEPDAVAFAEQVEPAQEEVPEKIEEPKKDKKKKKSKKEEPKEEPAEENDGWVKSKNRNIDVSFGIIRIKVKPNYGLFNISVINDMDKSIPVLATANEYVSSSFYLRSGKKIYKLNENSAVKCSAEVNYEQKTVLLIYSIPNVADVKVSLAAIRSAPENDIDMLKFSSEIINTGSKKGDFALKVVLDTVLGEIDRHHFYDNENNPVRNELGLRAVDGEKWYVSRNGNATMQILPYGADTTTPALFALGNLGTFQNTTWEPDMLSYRAFDTVLSYNNSAVCIIWPDAKIASTEKKSSIFYLAFSTGDNKPAGEQFVYAAENNKNDKIASKNESLPDRKVIQPEFPENPFIFNEPKQQETEKKTYDFHDEAQKNRDEGLADASSVKFQNKDAQDEFKLPPAEVEVLKPKETPAYEQNIYNPKSDVKFDVAAPSKYQLSDEYIQNLLNRIAALEESGEAVNRSELLQLNAELDAILEALRQ